MSIELGTTGGFRESFQKPEIGGSIEGKAGWALLAGISPPIRRFTQGTMPLRQKTKIRRGGLFRRTMAGMNRNADTVT
jgi:hypothetical protein